MSNILESSLSKMVVNHVAIKDIEYTFILFVYLEENIAALENLQRNHHLITVVGNSEDMYVVEHEKFVNLKRVK